MVLAEAPFKGARSIDHDGYTIVILQGSSYIDNKEAFLEIATPLQAEAFHRDPVLARRFLEENLAEDKETAQGKATLMLIRPLNESIQGYVGYGMHREISIPTSKANLNVLYGARTIRKDHRRKHIGRFVSQEALVLHRDVDMVGYRTNNPASIWSNNEVIQRGEHFPFDKLFTADPLVQEVMLGLWWRVKRFGTQVDWVTGVSKGDLGVEEPAYEPDPNHAPTMRILRIMEGKLKMNLARGDSVIALGYV